MSQAQTRTFRKKAESLSLSAKFFTLALHVRLRAQHPPTADKLFLRSSSRCRLTNAEPQTGFDAESRRLVIFLSLPRQHQQERAH